MPKRPGEYVVVRDGHLEHLDRDGRHHPNSYSIEEKLEFYRGLLQLALDRGNSPAPPPIASRIDPASGRRASGQILDRRNLRRGRGLGSALSDQIRKVDAEGGRRWVASRFTPSCARNPAAGRRAVCLVHEGDE
jgi:hypothetical protein